MVVRRSGGGPTEEDHQTVGVAISASDGLMSASVRLAAAQQQRVLVERRRAASGEPYAEVDADELDRTNSFAAQQKWLAENMERAEEDDEEEDKLKAEHPALVPNLTDLTDNLDSVAAVVGVDAKEIRRKSRNKLLTFFRNAGTISVDDITSMIDTLLLLDTLMLGFLIALLTQSSAGKSDFMERDGFNFRTVLVENNIFESHVKIESHYILTFGQVGCCCYFVSIGFGVATYLNLNFSRAREDEEILDRFAAFFVPFIVLGYLCFLAGLFIFFICFQSVLDTVFPSYCTPNLDQPVGSIPPLFRGIAAEPDTNGMHEITPDEWEHCLHESITERNRWSFMTFVWVSFPLVIVLGFALNLYIDCTHSEDIDPTVLTKDEADVGQLLIGCHPKFAKYIRHARALTPD